MNTVGFSLGAQAELNSGNAKPNNYSKKRNNPSNHHQQLINRIYLLQERAGKEELTNDQASTSKAQNKSRRQANEKRKRPVAWLQGVNWSDTTRSSRSTHKGLLLNHHSTSQEPELPTTRTRRWRRRETRRRAFATPSFVWKRTEGIDQPFTKWVLGSWVSEWSDAWQ